ncbi:MAG: adenylosuccinate lyase, partial [Candidatus Micrarchaeota archaeon]
EIGRAGKKVELKRVKEIESQINHDLMAMVRALAEKCRAGAGGYVHLGATSYDIEDTATALILRDAVNALEKRAARVRDVLISLAKKHKKTVCIGRTHGQHAVPTTYGMKFALYVEEMRRNLERLDEVKKRIYVGKMTGAVGTMATLAEINPAKAEEVQNILMRELGLTPARVTNQVVQRDRHAETVFVVCLVACALEKIAKEIRNLQRSEILEVAEPFKSRQVGSSTMPQKRNPHRCERVCGLARVVRGNLLVTLENIPLEHERDLTNSASERIAIPEAFMITNYMLKEMEDILANLTFFPQNIRRNLEMSMGLVMAERVMIALTKKGMGRQAAHEKIREASITAFSGRKHLKEVLARDREVGKLLSRGELEKLFNPETYVGRAEEIVERATRA